METTTLIDGLCFGEGPRWHDGRLWFSDMHAHEVCTVSEDGTKEVIVNVPQQPSGLGWLPDGRLLIVSMLDRRLLCLDDGQLTTYADLSGHATFSCNDMVVDRTGRAYVGNFGFDLINRAPRAPAELVLVQPGREVSVVADDLDFPNGTVITPDGRTLIVGETMGARLTAFDIEQDGALANRRTWASLTGAVPDGICLDEDGGIWVASPSSNEVLRVLEGGAVTDRVTLANPAYACMLGGASRRRLFILTAETSDPALARTTRSGKVEFVDVAIPGAGLP
jgi:sugar lactone lactonase YvrE